VTSPVIEILGLEVFAHHGVHEREKQHGQTFVIDLRMVCRSDAATRSDSLEDAVDYGAVSSRVVELATSTRHDLLERLAAVIADDLLDRFAVSVVTVTVHKPWAPIPHRFRDVTVTVERGGRR
jgi:7,8-dihydroneopterin aldolase/epimerase/oxygenase